MSQDRTLAVSVYVIGQQFKNGDFEANVTYIQTAANPPLVGMVSFRNGDIDLSAETANSNFTSNVDITFTLVPLMFDMNGNPVQCVWATPISKGISVTPVDDNMTASYLNSLQIFLDDDDDASNTYTYKLGVMLPAYNNYFIGLDPKIVNTGTK